MLFSTDLTYRTSNNEIRTQDLDFEPTDCLGVTLFKQMQLFKEKTAQIDSVTGHSVTFDGLLRQCIRTALHMTEEGVTISDTICICSENNKYSAIPFVAAQFLGARTAALDPALSLNEMSHLFKLANPKLVFATVQSSETVRQGLEQSNCDALIVLFEDDSFGSYLTAIDGEDEFTPQNMNVHDTALVSFSSGTSGPPKGVLLSHYALMYQVYNILITNHPDVEYLTSKSEKIHSPMTVLNYTSMYWISSTLSVLSSIVGGLARLLSPRFTPENNYQLCHDYQPFLLVLTPANVLEIIKSAQVYDLPCLTNMFTIGSKMECGANLKKLFPHTEIYQNYGLTEAGAVVTAFHPDNRQQRTLLSNKPQSVGLPERGVAIRIVDLSTGMNAMPWQRGELRVKCKTMMDGYLGADTSKQFDSDGWLMTGDVGYYDEDHCFYITDRIKDVFKYRGWFVSPTQLEGLLLGHPCVEQAAVIGVPCLEGESALGFVVRKDDCRCEKSKFIEYVDEKVQEGRGLSGGVRFIDRIPVTVTGKTRRNELKALYLQGKL